MGINFVKKIIFAVQFLIIITSVVCHSGSGELFKIKKSVFMERMWGDQSTQTKIIERVATKVNYFKLCLNTKLNLIGLRIEEPVKQHVLLKPA